MFESSKKAAHDSRRLIAVAAVPALFILVLSLLCRFAPIGAGAMYVVSNDGPVHVDDLEGDVFLTDGFAGLVSRTSGNELDLASGLNVTTGSIPPFPRRKPSTSCLSGWPLSPVLWR